MPFFSHSHDLRFMRGRQHMQHKTLCVWNCRVKMARESTRSSAARVGPVFPDKIPR